MVEVLPIETPTLGDRSYLAHDGSVAVVIDPQRDTDRITALAEGKGARITHVAETHIHNDYVSGGLALSRAPGAAYLVNAADPVSFAREPVSDGDTVDIGSGSFCAATPAQAAWSTIGREKQLNPALTLSERAYVETLLAGLDAYPAYYAHMGPANLAGPGRPDLSAPQCADAADIRRRIESGQWVVDLRDRVAFSAGFVPGSFSFPLDGSFASYLGWILPRGTPVTLLGETPEQVAGRHGVTFAAFAAWHSPGIRLDTNGVCARYKKHLPAGLTAAGRTVGAWR